MIHVEGVTKTYGSKVVLDNLDLDVQDGETFVVIGKSGSGKSTLLRLMIGLTKPDSGRVVVLTKNVPRLSRKRLRRFRTKMGYLFQSGALVNWLTLAQNVALPLLENPNFPRKRIDAKVMEVLYRVGLYDAAHLMPDQLSGGMRKRGGLARSLVTDPQVMLYDEPTTGLDPVTAHAIDQLIIDLKQRTGVTSVVVSHDMEGAFRVADRIAMLYRGRIIATGTPDEIRLSADPVVHQFITGSLEGPLAEFAQKEEKS